jgi:hypothetical protein
MQTEEPVIETWLSCIGLMIPSKELGPCLIMINREDECSGFYCVKLDKNSSFLVSPCFEHFITLKYQPIRTEAPILCYFTKLICFSVVSVKNFRCLVPSEKMTQKELINQLTELIGNTLFLQMNHLCRTAKRENTPFDELFRFRAYSKPTYPLFFSYENEVQMKYLDNCLCEFDQIMLKNHDKKNPDVYKKYWKHMREKYTDLLTPALNEIVKYSNKASLYDRNDIYRLFDTWNGYESVGRYFVNQFICMKDTYILYLLFQENPSLIDISQLTLGQTSDLCKFCLSVRKRESFYQIDFSDYLNLINCVLRNKFYDVVVSLLVKDTWSEDYNDLLISYIVDKILIPTMVIKVEQQAKNRTDFSKASVDALTIRNIYSVYHSLCSPSLEYPEFSNDLVFTLEEEEAEAEEQPVPFKHSIEDFKRILRKFTAFVKNTVGFKTQYEWKIKIERKVKPLKMNSVLFFICVNKPLLQTEKDLYDVHENYLRLHTSNTIYRQCMQSIEIDKWQESFNEEKNKLQNDHFLEKDITLAYKKLQQHINYVLFTPLELRKNEDLQLMSDILCSDLHCTSVLKEEKNACFYLQRMTQFFSNHSLLAEWFRSFSPVRSSDFSHIDSNLVTTTVIIPECHTLSTLQLLNILKWIYHYRQTIKRIVMLGSFHILPVTYEGQAFLDLLKNQDAATNNSNYASTINPLLFNTEELNQDFRDLLNTQWVHFKWPDSPLNLPYKEINVLRNRQTFYKEKNRAILFESKTIALVMKIFEHLYAENRTILLHCLTKSPFGSQTKKNTLYDAMVKNGLPSNMKCEPLDMNDLMQCNTNRPTLNSPAHYFIISKSCLLSLDKNEIISLFTVVKDCLFVTQTNEEIAKYSEELIPLIINTYEKNKKPNIRYSYSSLC